MKKSNIALIPIAALLATPFAAQAEEVPNWYVGFGYGQYKLEFETDTDTDFDDDRDALNVYVGGRFTRAIGAEITFYEFDDAEDSTLQTELEGASIAGVFYAPLWENRFDIYLKLGWFFWESEVETAILPGAPLTEDFEGDDFFYGAGVQFGFTDTFGLRLEYDRFELEDDIEPDLDYASVNLQFSF